jgi:soluble lytic murein transglycosylase-like protein
MHFFFIIFTIFMLSVTTLHAADLYTFIDEEGNTYYTNIPGEGRMRVPLPVKKAISEPLFKHSQNGEAYEPMIVTASQRYSVDPNLVRAVIKAESNFNHRAVSPKGALGLMQLMPETAHKMTVTNPFNPEENIQGGVRYLSELLHLFNWNLPLALAAYNAGPERVIGRNEIPPIEETRNYVKRVRMYYRDFKESFLMYK